MGKRLAKRAVRPELVVSSPAVRALTTAQLIARELGFKGADVVVDEQVYGGGPHELIEVIRGFDNRFDRVMLVGHNPALTELVNLLTDSETENVPTCGVAVLGWDTECWVNVGKERAELLEFDYPKKLKR